MARIRQSALAFLVPILVAARLTMFIATGYIADDSFITYRYARNLSAGEGFVYNQGVRVQGTSTPFYTLLLASAASVAGGDSIPHISLVISIAADVGSSVLLWLLLTEASIAAAWIVSILFALYPKIVLVGISGMEAPLVVFLMLLSFLLMKTDRQQGAGIAFAFLLLTRADGMLWFMSCLITFAYIRKRIPWRALLIGILPMLAWLAFSKLYFGQWLPNSILAKSISWNHLFPIFDPLRVVMGYFPFQGLDDSPSLFRLIAGLLFLAVILISATVTFSKRTLLVVFPLFVLVHLVFFSAARVVMADWYYYPAYIALFVSIGLLLSDLWKVLHRQSARLMVVGMLIIGLIPLFIVGAQRWKDNPAGLFRRQNMALGTWLHDHASPNASVLVEPIGFIGWYSGLYIHDYIGLVSPDIVEYRRQFNSDSWYLAYIAATRPEYIVMRNWEIPANTLFHGYGDGMFRNEVESVWFHSHYDRRQWSPGAASRDSIYLVLFQLKPGGALAE